MPFAVKYAVTMLLKRFKWPRYYVHIFAIGDDTATYSKCKFELFHIVQSLCWRLQSHSTKFVVYVLTIYYRLPAVLILKPVFKALRNMKILS